MKHSYKKFLKSCMVFLLIFLVGCRSDQLSLERTSIALVVGIDQSQEEGDMTIYQTNPVFSREATDTVSTLQTTAHSLRQARDNLDSQSAGTIVGGKLQVLLLGKELMKEQAMFEELDVFYRDPKNSPNARVAMVDGPIREIMEFKPEDKPRLAVYLSDLIDTTHLRENAVLTTLQEFHYANFEKGITPAVTEILFKGEEIQVKGSALLDENGKYVFSAGHLESSIIQMLRKDVQEPIPISLVVEKPNKVLSVGVTRIKRNIDVSYKDDQLVFDIDFKLKVSITENTSSLDLIKDSSRIESIISKKIEKKADKLIKKVQDEKIEPFGLGVYVRAYEYDKWKTFEDDWPEEFSKAKVNVKTSVSIIEHGVIQ
ncbi:Ger(x)C family spore germination protein [Guptibacillus algicola]|uniref:Ger(x)C family spore germination protein n=1 Tax=Guptibacillus algicola TaxID=225844 RepID=UPI001CD41865|nr:Ger(x)C family spore germination protein [Alkalihalobacillus algicola]MCA0988361.1 Ger(x)C family spore germination protein [Alkalihalobacillus algicola]